MDASSRLTRLGALAVLLATVYSSALPGQTALTKQVMREKLTRSQALLGALVTSNWATLEREGQALEAATYKPGWDALRSPEYIMQTGAFHLATQALIRSAEQRDQAAARSAYNGLVASCVECHRYVARMRIVGVPPQLPLR